jgi:hypothetical protein
MAASDAGGPYPCDDSSGENIALTLAASHSLQFLPVNRRFAPPFEEARLKKQPEL